MTSILFEVGSTCVGGAERVVLRLAQGLRKLRPDWRLDCLVLCVHGGLEEEYRATFDNLWPGPSEYKDSGWRIANLVKEHKYDIVHAIDSFGMVSAGAELCQRTHFLQNVFPNVATSPFAPGGQWLNNADNPYSAFVTEIGANLEHLLAPGRPPHIKAAVPNGIDLTFWTPDPACKRDIDVVWCARTDPEKGIDKAMELVPLLCGRGLEYRMVTSEKDGPQERLMQLVNQWSDTFGLHSTMPPDQLRALFRRSKVFLSTSQVEGMPATPIEAAACGCWPVVPNIDGLLEVFGVHGIATYETPYDIMEMAASLQKCSAIYTEAHCQIARAVATHYGVDAMVRGYLEIYDRLLDVKL